MTEQQINNLGKILASSETIESSSQLDKIILTAAHQNKPIKKSFSLFNGFHFQPLSFASSVVLSIAFTIFIFAGMGQLISIEHPSLANEELTPNNQTLAVTEKKSTSVESATLKPEIISQAPMTPKARDQLLVEMALPDTKYLLNRMEFSFIEERDQAETSITAALGDIQLMIADGELNDARQRYERLRRSCETCSLPVTLEALVLNANAGTTRS